MAYLSRAVLLLIGLMTAPVLAEERLVVVELYTSQGCSSCPPADAFLHELASRDDVLPLALHVDYWDYIGWADSFAQPAFTERQHAYARAAHQRTVYTPQMVVGGVDHVVGTRPMQTMDLIANHSAVPDEVELEVSRSGDTLSIHVDGAIGEPLLVQLVRYRPSATVEILRGENAGRTLEYSNIVTSWEVVHRWPGSGASDIEVTISGPDSAAVILQRPGPGLILAAARG